jgi:hypothetical protein
MFAMPLSAQAASYTYIDQRAPYKNQNSPMLTALNLPKVGTTFKVQVPRGYQSWPWCCFGTNYYLAFGVRNPNVAIPGLGGFLFTSADVVLRTPYLTNWQQLTATMSFPIPNSPQLVGVRFYQQVLAESYAEFVPSTYYLSRGGVGVIGK